MRKSPSAAQWVALRALAEGEPSSYARLGAAAGFTESTVARRAAKEGWKKLDFRKPGVVAGYRNAVAANAMDDADWLAAGTAFPAENAGAAVGEGTAEAGEESAPGTVPVVDMMRREIGRIVALGERGIVEKARIDGLLGIVRLAERSGLWPADHGAGALEGREQEKKSDEELAAVYARIDDRIVELAEAYARMLVAGEYPPADE